MIIGISGGAGFVGSALLKHLIKLDKVKEIRVIVNKTSIESNPKVRIIRVNLLDDNFQLFDFFKNLDVFFHCAAEIHNKDQMYKLHVKSLQKMLSQNKNINLRWIQLSSVGVYGPIYENNVVEDTDFNPVNEYERTKAIADKKNFI